MLHGRLRWLWVIDVSLIKEHVAFKLIFCVCHCLLLLLVLDCACNFILFIASPVVGVCLYPVAHTDPTKLKSATETPHVVAASILLDWLTALGTLLSVGQDPVCILRFTCFLLNPLLIHKADGWLMWLFTAQQTSFCATLASTYSVHRVILLFETKYTTFTTAPCD